jgi:hypothetical protein
VSALSVPVDGIAEVADISVLAAIPDALGTVVILPLLEKLVKDAPFVDVERF